MELEEYLPRLRAISRLLLEAALEEDATAADAKGKTAVEDLRGVVGELLEAQRTRGTGITAKKILDEVAYLFGYQDGDKLLIALDVKRPTKEISVPPPPPGPDDVGAGSRDAHGPSA